MDLVTVKEILGHSRIEMTMRYAHPTPENKRKAVAVLESIFRKRPGTKHAQTDILINPEKTLTS